MYKYYSSLEPIGEIYGISYNVILKFLIDVDCKFNDLEI